MWVLEQNSESSDYKQNENESASLSTVKEIECLTETVIKK